MKNHLLRRSRWRWAVLTLLAGLLMPGPATQAHIMGVETRPAFLEIKEIAPGRYTVLWCLPRGAGQKLPVVLKFPNDVRNVTEPIVQEFPDSIVERRLIEAPGAGLAGQHIEFVGLQVTITDVLVRTQLLDGRDSTALVTPVQAYIEFAAPQGWLTVAALYLGQGIEHIVFGLDHLLFVLGLLLIVKDWRMLLKTITAFTLAHSLTLAAATLGYAHVPVLLLNALIALSILFLGPEIVRSWRNETSLTIRHPWGLAFIFGLIHGFGFAGVLLNVGLPPQDLPLALVSFNVGVEIGQIGFVTLVLLLERSFRRLEICWPRWVRILPAYAVGSLGAFWTIQRVAIMLTETP